MSLSFHTGFSSVTKSIDELLPMKQTDGDFPPQRLFCFADRDSPARGLMELRFQRLAGRTTAAERQFAFIGPASQCGSWP